MAKLAIEWELGEITERLEYDWAEYYLTGEDEQGNTYTGFCQTYVLHPEEVESLDIYGIEKTEI
jgi:hypothetical protein